MTSCIVTPEYVPCVACRGNGWQRDCPDCWVDYAMDKVACKTHHQGKCTAHQVGQPLAAEHEPRTAKAEEPKLTFEEVLTQWRKDHPDWQQVQEAAVRWVADNFRGTITYQQGLGGSPGYYGASVHLRATGRRLSPAASIEHRGDSREGLLSLLQQKYPGFRVVADNGKPLALWLTKAETDVQRPLGKKRRQPVDILEKTTPKSVKKKVGRPRKTAVEIERAVEAADIKGRVAAGVAAGLASAERHRQRKHVKYTPGFVPQKTKWVLVQDRPKEAELNKEKTHECS